MSKLDSVSFTDAAKKVITVLKGQGLQNAQTELVVRRDDQLEFIELCMVFLEGVEKRKDGHIQDTWSTTQGKVDG